MVRGAAEQDKEPAREPVKQPGGPLPAAVHDRGDFWGLYAKNSPRSWESPLRPPGLALLPGARQRAPRPTGCALWGQRRCWPPRPRCSSAAGSCSPAATCAEERNTGLLACLRGPLTWTRLPGDGPCSRCENVARRAGCRDHDDGRGDCGVRQRYPVPVSWPGDVATDDTGRERRHELCTGQHPEAGSANPARPYARRAFGSERAAGHREARRPGLDLHPDHPPRGGAHV